MQRIYKCIKWEIIGFRKKTKTGKSIVICVWKAKTISQKEAMLITGKVWKNTVRNHNEWCARGMNWWRDTQKKLEDATLMSL
jgi:hypothetical protein